MVSILQSLANCDPDSIFSRQSLAKGWVQYLEATRYCSYTAGEMGQTLGGQIREKCFWKSRSEERQGYTPELPWSRLRPWWRVTAVKYMGFGKGTICEPSREYRWIQWQLHELHAHYRQNMWWSRASWDSIFFPRTRLQQDSALQLLLLAAVCYQN